MAGSVTPFKATEYVILDDGRSMSEKARLLCTIAHNNSVWIGDPEALSAFNDGAQVRGTTYPWRAGTSDMNMRVDRHKGLHEQANKMLRVGLLPHSLWEFCKVRDYPGCIGVFACSQGGWFRNVMILVRYVPDGIKVSDVKFEPIEIIDVLEPFVTHKTVVSSALAGEIECEFDIDLTAMSCSALVLRVLDALKIPVHHGHKLVYAHRLIKRYKETVVSKFGIGTDIVPRKVTFVEPAYGTTLWTPQPKKRRLVGAGFSASDVAAPSSSSQDPQAPESAQSRACRAYPVVPIDMNAVIVSAHVRYKLNKGYEAREVQVEDIGYDATPSMAYC